MEGRHVDVTIISAEDLKKVNLIGKMQTYAVACVDPAHRKRTSVDKDGGSKPKWNQTLSFSVPESLFQQPHARLTVEIYSRSSLSDDKFVGATAVSLSELAQKTNQEEQQTYQLVKKSGKVKGSLRMSIRVGEKTTIGGPAPAAAYAYGDKQYDAVAAASVPYGYPTVAGGVAAPPAPYGYPPAPAPYPQGAYGGYGGPGYYQPPPYYAAQPPPNRRPGGGGLGMGLGAGLLAGAVGGLIVGDIVDDAFDGCDGGFDF